MARKATREFEERTFVGQRVALALQALKIPQDKFLKAYDDVVTPRKQMSDTIAELQEQISALRSLIAAKGNGGESRPAA